MGSEHEAERGAVETGEPLGAHVPGAHRVVDCGVEEREGTVVLPISQRPRPSAWRIPPRVALVSVRSSSARSSNAIAAGMSSWAAARLPALASSTAALAEAPRSVVASAEVGQCPAGLLEMVTGQVFCAG